MAEDMKKNEETTKNDVDVSIRDGEHRNRREVDLFPGRGYLTRTGRDFARLFNDFPMNAPSLFETMLHDDPFAGHGIRRFDDDDGHEASYEFDLPGISKGDISVSVDGDVLRVSAHTGSRSYDYATTVDDITATGMDYGHVHADFENGVLRVSFPLPKGGDGDGKPVSIEVK